MAATKSDAALIAVLRKKLKAVMEERRALGLTYRKAEVALGKTDDLCRSIDSLITKLEGKEKLTKLDVEDD